MSNMRDIDNKSKGVFPQNDGTFLAMTLSQSRDFKTEKGAIKWLSKFGIAPDGSRIK